MNYSLKLKKLPSLQGNILWKYVFKQWADNGEITKFPNSLCGLHKPLYRPTWCRGRAGAQSKQVSKPCPEQNRNSLLEWSPSFSYWLAIFWTNPGYLLRQHKNEGPSWHWRSLDPTPSPPQHLSDCSPGLVFLLRVNCTCPAGQSCWLLWGHGVGNEVNFVVSVSVNLTPTEYSTTIYW